MPHHKVNAGFCIILHQFSLNFPGKHKVFVLQMLQRHHVSFILFSCLIAHSFGRRMLYPGSVGLLQKAMRPMLQQGQARLIEEVRNAATHSVSVTLSELFLLSLLSVYFSFSFSQFDGQRNKLVACDGNEIDTMFVDQRRDGTQNGQTLVNSCIYLLFLCLEPTEVKSYHITFFFVSENVWFLQ